MQHLEGLQYAAVLDLRMGYYTIRILPSSQDMKKIYTDLESSSIMGMCNSGYIFQAKVDNLLNDIEGFKTYVNDIFSSARRVSLRTYNK